MEAAVATDFTVPRGATTGAAAAGTGLISFFLGITV